MALLLLASCANKNRDADEPRLADPTTTTEPGDGGSEETFAVGDRVESSVGNFFTLHAYEQPVAPPDEFSTPEPGQEWAVADIEFCATVDPPSGATTYYVGPGDFELVMPDNTRRGFDIDVREPGMHYVEVGKGDCLRGWITFSVPKGQRPKHLLVLETDPAIKYEV